MLAWYQQVGGGRGGGQAEETESTLALSENVYVNLPWPANFPSFIQIFLLNGFLHSPSLKTQVFMFILEDKKRILIWKEKDTQSKKGFVADMSGMREAPQHSA